MTDTADRRTERLKAALRDNLRRRKAQVRGRAGAAVEPAPGEDPSEPAPDADPRAEAASRDEDDPS